MNPLLLRWELAAPVSSGLSEGGERVGRRELLLFALLPCWAGPVVVRVDLRPWQKGLERGLSSCGVGNPMVTLVWVNCSGSGGVGASVPPTKASAPPQTHSRLVVFVPAAVDVRRLSTAA
jgi:hypothetical protein